MNWVKLKMYFEEYKLASTYTHPEERSDKELLYEIYSLQYEVERSQRKILEHLGDESRELLKIRVYENIINENIIGLCDRGVTYNFILDYIEKLDNYVPDSMIINLK